MRTDVSVEASTLMPNFNITTKGKRDSCIMDLFHCCVVAERYDYNNNMWTKMRERWLENMKSKTKTKKRGTGQKYYINASHNPSPPKKYPRETSKLMYTNVWIPIRGKIHGVCIIANAVWSTSIGGSVHNSVRFEGRKGWGAISMGEGLLACGIEAKVGGLSPRLRGEW